MITEYYYYYYHYHHISSLLCYFYITPSKSVLPSLRRQRTRLNRRRVHRSSLHKCLLCAPAPACLRVFVCVVCERVPSDVGHSPRRQRRDIRTCALAAATAASLVQIKIRWSDDGPPRSSSATPPRSSAVRPLHVATRARWTVSPQRPHRWPYAPPAKM